MNLPPLLTALYWLNPLPPRFDPWAEGLILGVFFIMTVAGVTAYVYRSRASLERPLKRAADEIATLLIFTGVAGIILFTFSFEQIPYLSMRIWYIVWAGWVMVWGHMVYQYIGIELPQIREEKQKRADYFKWHPKHR